MNIIGGHRPEMFDGGGMVVEPERCRHASRAGVPTCREEAGVP